MKADFYKHNLNLKCSKNITRVLKSNFLSTGNECKQTEKQLQNFFDIKYALLTNSWTNGAIAVLMALNLKKGDEVIIPSMTFIATANVIELLGAVPRFVDVDKKTLLIDLNKVSKAINAKTKAIIPVHLYGNMVDVKKLNNLVKKSNKKIYIIEDSAHCFEGKFNNYLSGKWSDCAIFSFYATKNITCGEGGAIVTNNKNLYNKVSEIRLHGMTKSAIDRFNDKRFQVWNMNRLGIKANMPDLLASLLPSQIKEVYKNHKLRKKAFEYYDRLLMRSNILKPKINDECLSAYHLYTIHINPKIRNKVLNYLKENNIGATINYPSVPKLNYYKKKYSFKDKSFPVSTFWGNGTISLPFYAKIKKNTQDFVIKKLLEALNIHA